MVVKENIRRLVYNELGALKIEEYKTIREEYFIRVYKDDGDLIVDIWNSKTDDNLVMRHMLQIWEPPIYRFDGCYRDVERDSLENIILNGEELRRILDRTYETQQSSCEIKKRKKELKIGLKLLQLEERFDTVLKNLYPELKNRIKKDYNEEQGLANTNP